MSGRGNPPLWRCAFATTVLGSMIVSIAAACDSGRVRIDGIAEYKERVSYTSLSARAQIDAICPGRFQPSGLSLLAGFETDLRRLTASLGRGLVKEFYLSRGPGIEVTIKLFVASENALQAHEMLMTDLARNYVSYGGLSTRESEAFPGEVVFAQPHVLAKDQPGLLGFSRRNVAVLVISTSAEPGALSIARQIDEYLLETPLCAGLIAGRGAPEVTLFPGNQTIGVGERRELLFSIDRTLEHPWAIELRQYAPAGTLRSGVISSSNIVILGRGPGTATVGLCLYNEETLWSKWTFFDVEVEGNVSGADKRMREAGIRK